MSQSKPVRLTELASDQAQLFAHGFAEQLEEQADRRRLTARLGLLETIHSVVENVNRFRSAEQRLGTLLRAFMQHIPGAQHGAIYLCTAQKHLFVVGAAFPGRSDILGTEIDAQGSHIDAAAQLRSPSILPDIPREWLSRVPRCDVMRADARSALVVPFAVGGRAVGVLSLENSDRADAFAEQDLDFAFLLSQYTAMTVDHARLVALRPPRDDWHSSELCAIQALAQTVPFGVLIVAQDQRRVWANPLFCRMTGFSHGDLGKGLHRLHRSLADDAQPASSVAGLEPQRLSLTRKDGSYCHTRAALIGFGALGIRHVKGYVGIFEDLGERNALERRLFHMQRLSSISTLMSGVAHELNGPLTAVIGFAELLLARQDVPPDLSKDLRTISTQAERSVEVMRELLDYIHLEKRDLCPVDVNTLVRQLVRFRMYAFQGRDLDIRLELSKEDPHTRGDAQQLQQALLNLINNAEQACASASRNCKLVIRTERREDHIRISVQDSGPGIPEEIRSRIFEPFFTTYPRGMSTGLGLTVCRQIIENHSGRIWAECEEDQGTTFVVELPTSHVAQEELACDPPEPECPSAPPARILVVDDERSISKLLSKVLTRTGHSVDTALDGREALTKLQANPYDIVFLDLKIPDIPGQAVYDWIKDHAVDLVERTIVLTGDTLNADTIDFLEQQHVTHLLKPFQLTELRDVLDLVWPC